MVSNDRPQYFGRDLEAMSFAANYHRWIVEEFAPFLGGEVAEVGAGIGNFSRLLLEHVDALSAYEPSVNMYPELERRIGDLAQARTINAYFGESPAGPFDAVVYVNVLEHVEDDLREARLMYDALNPGGCALIFVPALRELYSELDRKLGHYRRYHRAGLESVFTQAGFSIVNCRYFDMAGIVPWYVAFVLMKREISPGNVSLYDRWVVPVMRRVEGVVRPPLGKNLLLVARRPLEGGSEVI